MYSTFPDSGSNVALFSDQNNASDPGIVAPSEDSWLTTHPFDRSNNAFANTSTLGSGENTATANSLDSSEVGELEQMLSRIAGMLPSLVPGGTTQGASSAVVGLNGAQYSQTPYNDGQFAASPNALNQGPNQAEYSNFQASSVGDPHNAFSGTTSAGQSTSAHWDSMQSHHDLLDSSSFAGGFRVSSSTTSPQNNGTTMNGSVDIHTDNGRDDIRYTANGNVAVEQNGNWESLAAGSSVVLNDGTTLADNAQNQLTVGKTNPFGGSISTTLSSNGQGGVDLQASGQNVQLGGYLANSSTNSTSSAGWS